MKQSKITVKTLPSQLLMVLKLILFAIPWILLASIPEIIMFNLWNFINPTTEIGRLLTISAFFMGGFAICIVFIFLGIAGFLKTVAKFL